MQDGSISLSEPASERLVHRTQGQIWAGALPQLPARCPKERPPKSLDLVADLGLGALAEGHGWLAKFPVGNVASVQLRFNLIAKLIMCRSLESWVAMILNMKCK